jgi:hypothetical protein
MCFFHSLVSLLNTRLPTGFISWGLEPQGRGSQRLEMVDRGLGLPRVIWGPTGRSGRACGVVVGGQGYQGYQASAKGKPSGVVKPA